MAEGAILGFQRQNIEVEVTGTTVTVPDNNIARLMYYLHCVNSCIPGFEIPERLRRYQNYYLLSDDDRANVVAHALLLKPEILNNEVFFLVGDNDMSELDLRLFYSICGHVLLYCLSVKSIN